MAIIRVIITNKIMAQEIQIIIIVIVATATIESKADGLNQVS